MGLSASQGRMLLLTARKSDLEYRAQQISQKRLMLSQQLEAISMEYENATSNRQMKITTWLNGTATDSDNSSKTTNLTYAALVSGTVLKSSSLTGIQAYDRTEIESGDYAATTPYRLVDADGAIVVSSVDEIPTEIESTETTTKATQKRTDGNLKDFMYTTTSEESGKVKELDNYILASDIKTDSKKYTETDLYKQVLGSKASEGANKNLDIDISTGVIRVSDGEGYLYYNCKTGAKLANDNEKVGKSSFGKDKVTIAKTTGDIPASSVTKTEVVSTDRDPVQGADGKYTAVVDGKTLRYVVDESLKYGTSDSDGGSSGPNYLQDCIRNGKYLIQKGVTDTEDGDKFKWKNVAWDCIATIQDQYYQDDDDTAKAKYDRLQNEIQAQDKKLELELDNIETQRSAVTTEEESVKKVIDENIEGSFNAFG